MTQISGQPASPEAQAAKLRGILELAVTAIITIDDRGLIESINPATERLFGYSAAELIGQNVKMLMPEPYKAEHDGYITNYLETGVKKIIGIGREVSGRRKDGTTFPLHLSVSDFEADGRRYFTGMIHDLSDRKHVEEALRESERRLAQAQKMEAVGQLTGGIAHDFNNLLLVITGNLELLELHLDRDEQKVLAQGSTRRGGASARKLTDQLLTFARRRHMDAQIIQLNDLVVSITDMLRRTLGEHIMLSTSLARNIWATRADPGQFQSAIVNMAVNARDAMPQGGKLVVETRNIVLDADHADFQSELSPGDYVQLRSPIPGRDGTRGPRPGVRAVLHHQGEGPRHRSRLGDGLWLRQAVRRPRHDLQRARSRHDIQSVFPARGRRLAATASPRSRTLDPRARETILVVEDDARVRQLTITRLKLIGYQVLEASDGPKALDILARGQAVDLVFTDLVMPGGMSGREVAMRARELKPGIKVLLTSGYAEELVHGDDLEREQLKVLRKPYHQADLVAALREALATSAV